MNKLRVASFFVVVMLTLAACGGGSDEDAQAPQAQSGRTVAVDMVDHAFKAEGLKVAKGETITFRFTNNGTVTHEAFIGDAQQQLAYSKEVAAIVKKHGGQGAHTANVEPHDDHPEGGLHLDLGKTGELSYTFSKSGEVQIVCYEPGHLEAGMRLTIAVA